MGTTRKKRQITSIIDFKTGAPERWHSLQISGYEHLDCSIPLDFDEETHTYRFKGRVVPSVTQILFDMGCISEFSTWSEFARDRGTKVHQACALLPDRLDWSTVDARIVPYVMSFQEWLKVGWINIMAQEQRGYNQELGYAGTLDLRVGTGSSNATLYLQADGSLAKLKSHTDRRAWHTFVSMCNVWNWRHNGK